MPSEVMNIPCPHCDRETLIGAKIAPIERIDSRFVTYQVIGQECSCINSAEIWQAHVSIDEYECTEVIYEYVQTQHSNNPAWDEIYGRS